MEAALHLLYVMGESSHQITGQKGGQLPDWISVAVIMTIQSSVSTHAERCVTLAYHDLIERYMQVALQNNELIPVILQVVHHILLPNGFRETAHPVLFNVVLSV